MLHAMTEMRSCLPIMRVETGQSFGDWLAMQPDNAAGACLQFAKKGAAFSSLTKAEAINGWFDLQLDKYDAVAELSGLHRAIRATSDSK